MNTAASPSPGTRTFAPVLVWGVWALLFVADLGLVWKCGSNVPSLDDWYMVPYTTGGKELTAGWLWQQFGEHRFPLTRLCYIAVTYLTNDLRTGMYFQVLALTCLSAGMILAARRLRGWTRFTDVLFPLALLNFGHQGNLLWSVQLVYLVPVLLAGGLLLLVAVRGQRLSLGQSLLAGVCIVALILCGAHGLVVGLGAALWLGVSGLSLCRSVDGRDRRTGGVQVVLALLGFLVIGLYFNGFQRLTWAPPNPGVLPSLVTALQFLGMGLGPVAFTLWPFASLLMLLLLGSSGLLLLYTWWRAATPERRRVLGLLMLLGASVVWALGVGWGRTGYGPEEGFNDRYVTLAVLGVCLSYFVWEVHGRQLAGARVRAGLCILVILMAGWSMVEGARKAQETRAWLAGVEEELATGPPLYYLLKSYPGMLFFNEAETLAECIPMLRDAGVGAFRHLPRGPTLVRVPLPPVATAAHGVVWNERIGQSTGETSWIGFALPTPRLVWGVRVGITYLDEDPRPPTLKVFYEKFDPEQPEGSPEESAAQTFSETAGDQRATFWICETVSEIRVQPAQHPCRFRIREIVLLVDP